MSPAPNPLRVLLAILLPFLIAGKGELGGQETVSNSAQENGATPSSASSTVVPGAVSGQAIATALQRTVSHLDRAGRYDAIEPAVERTLRRHSHDWRVLFQGARIYSELERAGYWVDQRFRRGDLNGNPPKGARRVFSHQRDHVRALQLLDRAIRLSVLDADPSGKAAFYWEAAQMLTAEKAYLKMYELTDLSQLPTLQFHEPRVPDREAVPVDEEGKPRFFELPADWPSARNDGERLLWLLDQARRLDPEYEAEAEFIHAKHLLKGYLGVQTITEAAGYDPVTRIYRGDEAKTESLLESLATLTKSQAVAVVGDGVRQFDLPEEHNFILKLERMTRDRRYRSHAPLALEELAEIFENRRQYDRAAQYWEALVRLDEGSSTKESGPGLEDAPPIPSWEKERLQQIVKSWGRFEDARPVQVGEPLKLAYWYRNGHEVTFTAHRVNVTALVSDILTYLRSDPFPIDPNKISVSKLGLNIVRQGGDRYLKEKVAEWERSLTPSENHWDQRIEVPVPIEEAGAYLVEARIDGGHRCSVLVWINDMSILRRPLEDGIFYYVADKKKGAPVGWAKFTFIGYRLALVNQSEEPELDVHGEEVAEALQRQYNVLTKEITEWADAKGQLILDDSVLQPDYRWFLLASASNDRVAVLGFSDLKPAGAAPRAAPAGLRQFLTTDKTVYLPGQRCHFQGWLRAKQGKRSFGVPNSFSPTVALLSERDEVIDDVVLETNEAGGFSGSLDLPADLHPGKYRLVSHCEDARTSVDIEVEPNQSAPVRLILENPLEQVARGETWRLTVRSESIETGEPVAGVPVICRLFRRPHKLRWERVQPHAWLYGDTYDLPTPPFRWFPGWKYWGWEGDVRPPGEDSAAITGEGRTDKDGMAVISVGVPPGDDLLPVEEDYHLEVGLLNEPGVRPVTARVSVSDRPFKVYAKMDRPYYEAGDKVSFEAWARRYDGQPVTGKGELRLFNVAFNANDRPLERGWKIALDPGAGGYVRAAFPVPAPGQYRASYMVTDAAGHRIEGACVFIVVDDQFTGAQCRFNSLEILTDRLVYQPGDRARLRINTENAGQSVAVFVRPRDGVFGKAEVLRLDQKSTPYEVTVKAGDEPSFFVEAIILNRGEFEVHTREIYVSPPWPIIQTSLALESTTQRPGEETHAVVSLADAAGRPVSGEVALSLAPAALTDQTSASRPALAGVFWDERSRYEPSVEHGLKTKFQSFASPPEASMRPIGIFGSMYLDEPVEPVEDFVHEEDLVAGAPAQRSYAQAETLWPVAWWPAVKVDASGQARIALTLPEREGEWILQAWAIDDESRVGQSSRRFSLKRDWSLALEMPGAVVEGDRFFVRANVGNRREVPATARLHLQTPDALGILGDSPRDLLEIDPGKRHQSHWEVEAEAASEEAMLGVQLGGVELEGGEALQTLERPLRIHPRRETAESWWNQRLSGVEGQTSEMELEFSLPDDLVPEESHLSFHAAGHFFEQLVSCFNQVALEEGLAQREAEDLIGAVVPLLRFGDYLRRLAEDDRKRLPAKEAAWALEEGNLEQVTRTALDRVWARQRADGGWSPDGEDSNALSTASVLESLADLESCEWVTKEGMDGERLKRALERLNQLQAKQLALLGEGTEKKGAADTLDAYTYLTLVRHGRDSSTMRNFLFRDWKKLPVLGQLMLAQALHLRGDTEDRNTIRFFLGEKLIKNPETEGVQLEPGDAMTRWNWLNSAGEVQGRYLQFLVRVKGHSPVTDGVATQLLAMRRGPGLWDSHRAGSRALNGLLAYAALTEAVPAGAGDSSSGTLALWYGPDKIVESANLSAASWNAHRLTLSGTALADLARSEEPDQEAPESETTGDSSASEESSDVVRLRLVYSGEESVNVHGLLQVVRKPLIISRIQDNVSVHRVYARRTSPETESAAFRPGENVALGEVLDVTLKLETNRPLDHLDLTEHLPAGFDVAGDLPDGWKLEDGVIRVSLPSLEEKQEFRYQLEAIREGRFHALPARLQARHLDRVQARSDEMVFLIR